MQLNPTEIAEVIRQRIEGLPEANEPDESPGQAPGVTVTATLDYDRVQKMIALHELLGTESRADALAAVIDIAAEIVTVLHAGGRVTLRDRNGRASALNLKRSR